MKILKSTICTAVGLFGLAALVAVPSAADQVILDDLIVDGSACIGQDCVNGESFGFDTIRIKENNLRIKAQDTSSTASFPTQDWQLTFNDSSNGGANRFSVDAISPTANTPFTIEAGSNNNALYVNDNGNIGFGTSAPVVDLHVKSGNTPTLRLEQDGSSGFTPQTWDLAGNEANFFIRDVTNGSALPFRIEPGVASNLLYLDADEEVGIGTTSPGAKLHVLESGSPFSAFAATGLVVQHNGAASNPGIITVIGGSSSNSQFNFGDSGGEFQGRILYSLGSDLFSIRTSDDTTDGQERVQIDNNETASQTALLLSVGGGAVVRVSVDASNSCGAGFRCLRVPN